MKTHLDGSPNLSDYMCGSLLWQLPVFCVFVGVIVTYLSYLILY